MPPVKRKEPETITISEDDDEDDQAKQPVPSTKASEKQPEDLPMDLVKQPSPAAAVITHQIIKEEPMEEVASLEQQPTSEVKPELQVEENLKLIAESLLELSNSIEQPYQVPEEETTEKVEAAEVDQEVYLKSSRLKSTAFHALLRGIELHQSSKNGLDMLCAVTQEEGEQVPYFSSHMSLSTRLDILCCVTKGDKSDFDHYIDPLVLLKQNYNLHDYHTETSAETIANFIQQKTQYFKKLLQVQNFK